MIANISGVAFGDAKGNAFLVFSGASKELKPMDLSESLGTWIEGMIDE